MRRFILLLVLVFILGAAIFCGFFLYTPIIINSDLHYILQENTNAHALANDLHKLSSLRYPILFRWLIKIRSDDKKLQAGEYSFPRGSTAIQVLNRIVHGKVLYHSFTIINGWNFYHTVTALENDPIIKHVLTNKSPDKIAKEMQLKHKTPEGLLFPETYYYTLGTTDLEILNRAYQTMRQYMQQQWPRRSKNFSYKRQYTALIIASMVEKETSLKREKPIIAAIILKRLKKWMHLQIDATVIYGLGKHFDGDLTRKKLRSKTPYNTYVHYGLPPTPIAMSGSDSINAVLHPAKTKKMYFVAMKNGKHVFSETLEQHNRNVAKYQLNQKS